MLVNLSLKSIQHRASVPLSAQRHRQGVCKVPRQEREQRLRPLIEILIDRERRAGRLLTGILITQERKVRQLLIEIMISQERKARRSRHAAVEEAVQANLIGIREEDRCKMCLFS